MLALATIYDGASRTEAAKIGGVTLQIVRDWVLKFNADGPEGLVTQTVRGQSCLLNDGHRKALLERIDTDPDPDLDGVVRWRIVDLCKWISDTFAIHVSKQTLSRELRILGYRRLSIRPHHAQTERTVAYFKKIPSIIHEIATEKGLDPVHLEIWFSDEARVGKKNKMTRRWAKRGSRPPAPQDQRTASTEVAPEI